MKAIRTVVVLLGLSGVVLVIWFCVRQTRAAEPEATESAEPAAAVSTVLIKSGEVSQTLTAYGTVTAEPGAITVLSASTEVTVGSLHVASGQAVKAGTAVIDVQPSLDTKLQLLDARNALEAARRASASIHERLKLKLVTNSDVDTADQNVVAAQSKFDDLTRRGADQSNLTITANVAGIIARVDVQPGQLVPAGTPLVELVPREQIEVRLGIEPTDAALLKLKQSVQLFTPDADEPIDGTLRLVTRRVNAESRLVDVFVSPSDTRGMMLDELIRAELVGRKVSGFVVPHEALLPDDDGFVIFTVIDGKAVKHAVKVSLQNDKEAVILGSGLHDGDAVITNGVLEVDDQTPVKASPATTAPVAGGDQK